MPPLPVTAGGDDPPGVVAPLTAALPDLRADLEDTSMTLLRGHFAMTLIVAASQPAAAVQDALAPVAERLPLIISVREVSPEPPAPATGQHHVLVLHGGDRSGIVARVSDLVA